jgi:hypothetical protein
MKTASAFCTVLLLLAAGCAPPGAAPTPAPPPSATLPDGPALATLHSNIRVAALEGPRFTHEALWSELGPIVDRAPNISRTRVGTSAEGRAIHQIRFGTGPTRVLMWSQMHGDESTATRALLDLFNLFASEPDHPVTRRLGERLTIAALPMLNPDGAERFVRHNAFGIDVNRDARMLETPEGRTLRAVHRELEPHFGFNLHDQSVRTRVGSEDRITAFALLAPPADQARTVTEGRLRAMKLAAVIRDAVEPLVPEHVARYSDTFNPRAFGDLMQSWGTSTVLFEAGGWRDDDEKEYLRTVNFVAIVGALEAIATGAYEAADTVRYRGLPLNGPQARDAVIRGGTLVLPGIEPIRADVAVNFGDPIHYEDGRVVEVGDLRETVARDTLDISGLYLHPVAEALDGGGALLPGAPAIFHIRGGRDASSPEMGRVMPDGRPGPLSTDPR